MKTYKKLITLPTFEERVMYLKTNGHVGKDTFGYERWINQRFYQSAEWKQFRSRIILRDLGHDLAMPGDEYEIFGRIIIHHIVPLTKEDIDNLSPKMLDPNNVITTTLDTHNLIHYGLKVPTRQEIERKPNDTCPWK